MFRNIVLLARSFRTTLFFPGLFSTVALQPHSIFISVRQDSAWPSCAPVPHCFLVHHHAVSKAAHTASQAVSGSTRLFVFCGKKASGNYTKGKASGTLQPERKRLAVFRTAQ
jgi:hypothetical protein